MKITIWEIWQKGTSSVFTFHYFRPGKVAIILKHTGKDIINCCKVSLIKGDKKIKSGIRPISPTNNFAYSFICTDVIIYRIHLGVLISIILRCLVCSVLNWSKYRYNLFIIRVKISKHQYNSFINYNNHVEPFNILNKK